MVIISNRAVAVVCLMCYSSCAGSCSQETRRSYADFYDTICMLAVDLGTYDSHSPTDAIASTIMRVVTAFNHGDNEEAWHSKMSYPQLARLAQCALVQTPQSAILRAEVMMTLADKGKRIALAIELLELVKNGMLTKLYEDITNFSTCVTELTMPPGNRLFRSHKGRKRKSGASIFGALASTCVQLGNIIGIVRPESRAVLSLFGVALNVVSRVIKSKRKRNKDEEQPDEQDLIIMTKEEFSAHMLSLLESAHKGAQGQGTLHDQELTKPHKGFSVEQPVVNAPLALSQVSDQLRVTLCAMLEEVIERMQQSLKVEQGR